VVRANFVGHKKAKKVDLKIVQQKITQLISRHLVRKTGYEAGTGILRLLGKAGNTGFSRHIKTGCNLPVCITKHVHEPKINKNKERKIVDSKLKKKTIICVTNFPK